MTTELPTPWELACMLYRLQFSRRTLDNETASVQEMYRQDAVRLLDMITSRHT